MRIKARHFIGHSLVTTLAFLKDSIFADECASKKGFLQARQAQIKIVTIFLLLLSVLFSRGISNIVYIYALCLLLALLSSINLGFFLRRTWFFIPLFSLFIAVPALFSFFSPGEPVAIFKIFGLRLIMTRQGAGSAVIFFLRVLTSVSLCVLLTLTTRHYLLLKALRSFRVPQVFVMAIQMCYRYVYLFIEVIQNTYIAIQSRVGFVSSSRKGQGIVSWNIACLWQRSNLLSQEVYHAMLSRGYQGEPQTLEDPAVSFSDLVWLLVVLVICGSLLYLDFKSSHI